MWSVSPANTVTASCAACMVVKSAGNPELFTLQIFAEEFNPASAVKHTMRINVFFIFQGA